MTHNQHFLWIGLGLIFLSLIALLALSAYQDIILKQSFIEIVSATWKNAVVS